MASDIAHFNIERTPMPETSPATGRHPITLFVSYAHADHSLVSKLLSRLTLQLAPSKANDYRLWRDGQNILFGDDWDAHIHEALRECDAGLVFLSPALLGSDYITQVELVELADRVLPVALQPTDFERHDHRGLLARQIYRWQNASGEAKPFAKCRTPEERDNFAAGLFTQLERRFEERRK